MDATVDVVVFGHGVAQGRDGKYAEGGSEREVCGDAEQGVKVTLEGERECSWTEGVVDGVEGDAAGVFGGVIAAGEDEANELLEGVVVLGGEEVEGASIELREAHGAKRNRLVRIGQSSVVHVVVHVVDEKGEWTVDEEGSWLNREVREQGYE